MTALRSRTSLCAREGQRGVGRGKDHVVCPNATEGKEEKSRGIGKRPQSAHSFKEVDELG